jgi:hypothetical protein
VIAHSGPAVEAERIHGCWAGVEASGALAERRAAVDAFNAASLAYLAATVGARERKMRAAFALHRAARLKKVD